MPDESERTVPCRSAVLGGLPTSVAVLANDDDLELGPTCPAPTTPFTLDTDPLLAGLDDLLCGFAPRYENRLHRLDALGAAAPENDRDMELEREGD